MRCHSMEGMNMKYWEIPVTQERQGGETEHVRPEVLLPLAISLKSKNELYMTADIYHVDYKTDLTDHFMWSNK